MRMHKFRSWDEENKIFTVFENGKYYYRIRDSYSSPVLFFDWNNAEQYIGRKDNTKWQDLTVKERKSWTRSGWIPSEFDGIEIYEGDIVKPISEDNILARGIVEFDNESGTFILKNEKGLLQNLFMVYLFSEGFEIIGNIHENKDLL